MKRLFLNLVAFCAVAGLLRAGDETLRNFRVTRNLSLDEAVHIALQQNPDILNAKEEIERTRGLVIEVRAQALPNLTATGVYSQQDKRLLSDFGGSTTPTSTAQAAASATPAVADTGGSTSTNTSQLSQTQQQSGFGAFSRQDKSWQITIEARQLLYAGGQVRAALRIARFTQDSSYWSLRNTIDTVIATTRRQFYDVLLNRALIGVQQESVALLQKQLGDQRNRFDAGTVPRFNVLQAEVALANVQPNLIAARNNYLIAQLSLAKTLGLGASETSPGAPPINAAGSLTVEPRTLDVGAALADAHERRPFLKVQRLQILTEVEDIKVQLAGYKPRIEANGGYEFRNSRASDDLSEVVNGWFFGATGSWDIFDGGATFGRVKQARAKLAKAKVTYDDSLHQVDLEVQQAIANVHQAQQTMESQSKNVESANEAVRLASERLSAGAGTQLDVLNAQVELTRARSTQLQARRDYNAALAELDRVTATSTRYEEGFDDPLTHPHPRPAASR